MMNYHGFIQVLLMVIHQLLVAGIPTALKILVSWDYCSQHMGLSENRVYSQ